jgi:ComF family protein
MVDAVLPPLCLICRQGVADPGTLCPACWSRQTFIATPLCAACGVPFDLDPGLGALCGFCVSHPHRFARARAVLRYDAQSRPLILGFKHADRLEGAPAFAAWMARAGAELLADAELLVPVPLHRWRLASRRYNQAALLAGALAERSGVATAPLALVRRRSTPPQGRMNHAARQRNLAGAIAPGPAAAAIVGRRVLLIDDVLTTGATADECARVLLAAGATAVDVLTLARVVRDEG